MEGEVLAAVIGAAAGLITGLPAAWASIRAGRKASVSASEAVVAVASANQAVVDAKAAAASAQEEAGRVQAEGAWLHAVATHGYVVRKVEYRTEILDLTGCTKEQRSWVGVQVVDPAVILTEIPHMQAANNAGVDAINFEWLGKHPNINVKVEIQGTYSVLRLTPGLKKSDGEISYRLTHSFGPGALLVDREEIAKAYKEHGCKLEYRSATAARPIEEMEITVKFPAGSVPECSPAIFPLHSDLVHQRETSKLGEDALHVDGDTVVLRVLRPQIGWRVAVCWLGV